MDLRLPIGGLFTIFGLVLTLYGAVSSKTVYAPSLGVNVNLDWGLVMLVFGVLMAGFGLAAQRRDAAIAAANREPVWPPPGD